MKLWKHVFESSTFNLQGAFFEFLKCFLKCPSSTKPPLSLKISGWKLKDLIMTVYNTSATTIELSILKNEFWILDKKIGISKNTFRSGKCLLDFWRIQNLDSEISTALLKHFSNFICKFFHSYYFLDFEKVYLNTKKKSVFGHFSHSVT